MLMKSISRIAMTLAVSVLVAASFASGQAKKPATAAKKVECPVCHMPLSAKKTKANPVAVRLKKGGPVMYCCAACKMPASVLVKPGKTVKKPHASAKMTGKPKG